MQIETVLSMLGLSISIGGLIPVFFMHNKVKEMSVIIVFISLALISGTISYINYQKSAQISTLSKEIISQVDKKLLTFDQLYEKLYYEKQSDINQALDNLVASGMLKHKVIDLKDDYGERYRVRGYFIE